MDTAEHLTIAISLDVDRARIFLRGELDLATAPLLRKCIDELLTRTGRSRALALVDMAELTFCDSSGLRVLLELADQSHRVGTNLRLTNVPVNILRVFDMTGTTNRLNVESEVRRST